MKKSSILWKWYSDDFFRKGCKKASNAHFGSVKMVKLTWNIIFGCEVESFRSGEVIDIIYETIGYVKKVRGEENEENIDF